MYHKDATIDNLVELETTLQQVVSVQHEIAQELYAKAQEAQEAQEQGDEVETVVDATEVEDTE